MPAKLGDRDDLGLTLTFLRWLKNWQQEDLAAASGVRLDSIQAIEQGRRRQPTLKTLGPLVAALGVDLSTVEAIVALVRRFRGRQGCHAVAEASGAMSATIVDSLAWGDPKTAVARTIGDLLHQAIDSGPRMTASVSRQTVRARAAGLWALVGNLSGDSLRRLVDEIGTFQTVEFCELLCDRSVAAAGDSATEAIRLADLAVRVSHRVSGTDGFHSRITGYACVHLENGRRVAGDDIPSAAQAFEQSLGLWHAGAADDGGLLNSARVLGLASALRRSQHRFPEALELIDQALAIDVWDEAPMLYLAKARTLVDLGDYETSLAVLQQQETAPADPDREPRRRYVICNLIVLNLCRLGQYAAAEVCLPELRALALQPGHRLDLLRADWLTGTVAGGQGRTRDAIAVLMKVREQFRESSSASDVALVNLELAELQGTLGRTADAQALAREAASLFAQLGIDHAAQRALDLSFYEIG